MSLNTEQSTQLREAVKSKLVEIGEYVDDQLTDYVMIMVTNKKSEKQMAEDLELFLGGLEQSTKFSSWLHSQLKLVASKPTLSNAEAEELAIQVDTNEFNEEQVSSSGTSGIKSRLNRTVPPTTTPTLITKPIASCIGAVIKHNEQAEEESMTETRHRLSSSVVKVSPSSDERRRNSTVTLQSGKSMLFKAVDAANKSITESSNKTKRVKTDVRKPFHDDQDSVSRRQVRADEDRRSGEENETTEKTGDRRSIEHRLSFETKALKTLDTNQRKVEADSTNEGIATTDNGSNTKFIVTFAGLDDQYTNKLTKKRSFNEMNELDELDYDETYGDYPLESEEMEMNMEEDQMEGLEDEMTDGTHQLPRYQKKKPIRCSYWPACEKGNACMFIHPNKPCTTFPNCPFGQQCHYIHPNCRFDGFCTRPDCPFTHTAKKQPPQHAPQQTVPSASGSQTNVVIGDIAIKQPANLGKQPAEAPKVTINKIQNPFQATGNNMYSLTKKNASINPQAASAANHYKLVHGVATSVTKPFVNSLPNCKFGLMCKNPNCPFVHPSTSSNSQFKWVANKTSGQQVAQQQVNKEDSESLISGSQQLETNSSSAQQRSQFNMESTMPQELSMSTN